MKILWITNTMFPAASKKLGLSIPVVGGWMYSLGMQIAASSGIRLAVATTYTGNELKSFDIDGVTYYLLPAKSKTAYQKNLEPIWQKICDELKPDLVHIHGSEYTHGLACLRACPIQKYVVSIQGLVNVSSRYYYGGITPKDILKNITFRDVIRRDSLFQQKRNFEKRGEFEKEYLQRTDHVIGRTRWDYAHTKAMNPSVNYHFCNRLLRERFYTVEKWDITRKTDHTIFCSQAAYPLKGLHQVLKAIATLKKDFPEIQLRVAGPSIINHKTMIEKIKISGYGSYLRSIIKKANLWDNVDFTGPLPADLMVDEYKNAHLFICPSSIENSPNSLGEAQLLGVPSISSYVGGVPDMVVDGQSGLLYRFEEIEILAENIRRIFTDDKLAIQLSSNGIEAASKRHDRQTNLKQILRIYNAIAKQL